MKLCVELELQDVYGGDGEVRIESTTKTTLKRRKNVSTVRDSIGIKMDDGTDQEKSETKEEPINTFRLNEKGELVLRLGGAHGKIWGAMKACAKQLKDLGDTDFTKYTTLMDMISVSPAWVVLQTDGVKPHCEAIPQIMAGFGSHMIVQRFDVVSKAKITLDFIFPTEVERKVRKLLSQLEVGTHLNKRRSSIKVLNITKDK